jgi:hypothetical protein
LKATQLLRRIAWTASFALAVAVLLWSMAALSGWITRGELVRDAQQRLLLLQTDAPLWRWSPRTPDDLVAGRAFGNANLLTGIDGVDSVSSSGTPFDLGLPLTQPVDLLHWPMLRILAKSSSPGRLGIIWESPGHGSCLVIDAAELSNTSNEVLIDLRQLQAQSTDPAHPDCSLPQAATTLRLRPIIPAGASWLLKDVQLGAGARISAPIDAGLELTGNTAQAGIQLDAWHPTSPAPMIRLPPGATAETLLELRDRILGKQPGAVIAPHRAPLSAKAKMDIPPWLGWAVCTLYLALLLIAAQYRAPEWVALLLILLGPLWLIIGLQWQLHPSIPAIVGFLGALGFAAWREWRQIGQAQWRWFGQGIQSWLWPLGLVVIAYALVVSFGGRHLHPLPWRHVLVYLAWASLQQWLILVVVMRRWETWGWPAAFCVLVTATTFGLLHTPNGLLMQLCFLAELYWAWCFMRTRSLAPIALAHAACALIVEAGLAGPLLRSLEISGRFFL